MGRLRTPAIVRGDGARQLLQQVLSIRKAESLSWKSPDGVA